MEPKAQDTSASGPSVSTTASPAPTQQLSAETAYPDLHPTLLVATPPRNYHRFKVKLPKPSKQPRSDTTIKPKKRHLKPSKSSATVDPVTKKIKSASQGSVLLLIPVAASIPPPGQEPPEDILQTPEDVPLTTSVEPISGRKPVKPSCPPTHTSCQRDPKNSPQFQ